MLMLRLVELFFSILYIAFLISEIFIPMAKSLPLFPSFRKKEVPDESQEEAVNPEAKKEKKRNA